MSELRQRLTLWFLRRFHLFRNLERYGELMSGQRLRVPYFEPSTTAAVEAEILVALRGAVHFAVAVDVLPTQRVGWLAHGQVAARLFEGGGPRG
jgi:hypothetical protein